MPVEQYGETQVHEMRFTDSEVMAIVLENIQERARPSYDFDTDHPIVLREGNDLIFRFLQRTITREPNSKKVQLKAMPVMKAKNGATE